MMSAWLHRVALVLIAAWASGCSSSGGGETPTPGAGGAGGQAAAGGSAGNLIDSGPWLDTGPGDAPLDGACAYVTEQATSTPLNLYIMLDKSSTMLGDKWDAARQGLDLFLNDPASAGIKVGINFFPREPDSTPACDQPAYKEPKVPFAALPGNAAALLQAISNESPNGVSTPIYPALGGAILKGIELAKNQPGDTSAVLLVTDGEPQGPAAQCSGVDPQDPKAIADLAAVGVQNQVLTFVVGLPGVNQSTANQIAAGGGSGAAIVVGTSNTKADFQAALATVRGKALPCEYLIPTKVAGGEVSPLNVNVLFTPGGSTEYQTIPQTTQDKCDGGGWYYDDPSKPTKILLCPSTCAQLKIDLGGRIDIMLGCKTVVK